MNGCVNRQQSAPITVVAIIGSLRRESVNRAVFEAAIGLCNPSMSLVEAPVADVPFYNGDVEQEGDPAAVVALKQAVQEADGLIFFTPQYNGTIPAVTKNALDWLSRKGDFTAMVGKPVGVVAATPGRHEVEAVRRHLAATATAASAEVMETSLGISSINHRFDAGVLDAETRESLGDWLAEFYRFTESRPSRSSDRPE